MKQFLTIAATCFLLTSNPCLADEGDAPGRWSAMLVKVSSEEEVADLVEKGADILRRRGDILLCLVPDEDGNVSEKYCMPPKDANGRGVRGIHGKNVSPTLDKAVEWFGASDILNGNGFERSYSGKGVVVGICDIGLDPLHPSFLDAEGHSRIRRITQYKEHEGVRLELEGDDDYAEWVTDTYDNFHATHVLGILAGDGAGSPYAGVATDADIFVSTSTLTDVGLLAGVEDIIDYAKEVGKPCVINLSMGNYTGAHDGTSLFSQYLDMCADDAIIVLSAGNEGKRTNFLHHDFTAAKPSVSFRLGNSKWNQIDMYGMTDIWGGDSTPLILQVSIFDDQTHKVIHTYDPVELSDYDHVTYEWNGEDDADNEWSLDGYLSVYGGVDPENGRYQGALVYEYDSNQLVENAGWARYLVAVTVSGIPGNDVEVYSDGTYTRLMSMSGNPAPDSSRTISDLACGHRVVSVGMYGNRSTYPVTILDVESNEWISGESSTGYEPGIVVTPSSYGTLRDGRVMPLTVAPGATLMSAASRPYLEAHPDKPHLMLDGTPWLSEGGTSMSSPYVAGYIATWLEAKPDLTPEDVIALIEDANVTDVAEAEDPRNGRGWFDPVSALRKLLAEGGVSAMPSDPGMLLRPDDAVTVYSIDGREVYTGIYGDIPGGMKGIHIVKTIYGVWKIVF